MKKMILLLFVLSISVDLNAQKRVDIDNLNISQLNEYKRKADTMRGYGMGFTLYGVGFIAVGGCISAIWIGSIPENEENFGIPIYPLAVGMVIGIPLTMVGIPLWTIGGHRKSEAEISLKKFYNTPGKSATLGLGITFRF